VIDFQVRNPEIQLDGLKADRRKAVRSSFIPLFLSSLLDPGGNMPLNPDPRNEGPKPPFPEQKQAHPGSVKRLDPPADHGESSFLGTGKLLGHAAIVTGADSGIGRAIAIAFAKEGADVLLSYLPEEESDALEVSALIHELGRKAIRLPGDIGSLEYAKTLVAAAIREFGHLDIVVNNAGFQMTHESIEEIPAEEFEHTFRTNVFGTFFLTQAALPKMAAGGSIISTTSIQAYEPGEQLVAYAATKAAIANMTKSLAKLAAKQGIRVNAVAPGPVWTPLIPSTMPAETVKSFGENTLFKRPAQPIEMAKIFVFLASAEASYVSGEIYGATGGRTPL
jgi:NAD(P)-dependent dehydrogenase (short-subunit alcohol dehydrogenase family)